MNITGGIGNNEQPKVPGPGTDYIQDIQQIEQAAHFASGLFKSSPATAPPASLSSSAAPIVGAPATTSFPVGADDAGVVDTGSLPEISGAPIDESAATELGGPVGDVLAPVSTDAAISGAAGATLTAAAAPVAADAVAGLTLADAAPLLLA